jgi:hypothetical protein
VEAAEAETAAYEAVYQEALVAGLVVMGPLVVLHLVKVVLVA